jgi:D-glycero-beta-D-manno-heptose 1-phosphate adenylyltransferase
VISRTTMDTSLKILSREDVKRALQVHRSNGKMIVLANGCFDLLHVGHIRYLQGSRAEGDILVVAVNSDAGTKALKGAGRPILDERGRAALVASLECVDYVVVFSEPNVESLLWELRPDVHAKGTDYALDTVPEREISAQLGIRMAIVGDPKNHSTRNLLASIHKRADG